MVMRGSVYALILFDLPVILWLFGSPRRSKALASVTGAAR